MFLRYFLLTLVDSIKMSHYYMINLIEDSSLSSEAIQTFILISESSDHFMLLKTHFHY